MEEGVGSIEFGPVLVASILLPVGCVGLAGEKEMEGGGGGGEEGGGGRRKRRRRSDRRR